MGPPDNDDEIREEYIGRHRVHFLGHQLAVPMLKVMTINDDADADADADADDHDHDNQMTSTWLATCNNRCRSLKISILVVIF